MKVFSLSHRRFVKTRLSLEIFLHNLDICKLNMDSSGRPDGRKKKEEFVSVDVLIYFSH